MSVEVLSAGLLTTVQDLGRPGWAHLGVPPSGALDRPALELGNGLLGNDRAAAALEATLLGPRLRFREAAVVALTGAETDASVAGRAVAAGEAVEIGANEVLDVGRCSDGARAYVCVRGGVAVDAVLGSRSTDLLTGLGPPPLRDGDLLEFGPSPPGRAQAGTSELPPRPAEPTLGLLPGPRDDWFVPEALDVLSSALWRVTPSSNRIGIRLEGPALRRIRDEELLSEPLVTGALQVPPSGQPILLLNDRPTTGGYPVLGVVVEEDLPLAAQLRPGQRLRFGAAPGAVR